LQQELVDCMRRIETGALTRNKSFDVFKFPETILARKALARIVAIREKMTSDYWNVQFTENETNRIDVTLESKILSLLWKTNLSKSEWDYLLES